MTPTTIKKFWLRIPRTVALLLGVTIAVPVTAFPVTLLVKKGQFAFVIVNNNIVLPSAFDTAPRATLEDARTVSSPGARLEIAGAGLRVTHWRTGEQVGNRLMGPGTVSGAMN